MRLVEVVAEDNRRIEAAVEEVGVRVEALMGHQGRMVVEKVTSIAMMVIYMEEEARQRGTIEVDTMHRLHAGMITVMAIEVIIIELIVIIFERKGAIAMMSILLVANMTISVESDVRAVHRRTPIAVAMTREGNIQESTIDVKGLEVKMMMVVGDMNGVHDDMIVMMMVLAVVIVRKEKIVAADVERMKMIVAADIVMDPMMSADIGKSTIAIIVIEMSVERSRDDDKHREVRKHKKRKHKEKR